METVPNRFICPITQDVMRDPVMTPQGINFERETIQQWLEKHKECPMTREPLTVAQLFPNRSLKEEIEEWNKHNPQGAASGGGNAAYPAAYPPAAPAPQPPPSNPYQAQVQTPAYSQPPPPQQPYNPNYQPQPSNPPPQQPAYGQQPYYSQPSPAFGAPPPPAYSPPPPQPAPVARAPISNDQPWLKYGFSQDYYDFVFATFLTFDEDGNGTLDPHEATTLCRMLNFPCTQADIRKMFAAIDMDKSGSIDFDEFLLYMIDFRPRPEQDYGLTEQRYIEVLIQFHANDTDGNGELDKNELRKLCQAMGYPHSHQVIDTMFRTVDTDRSGSICVDEFLHYMREFDPHTGQRIRPPAQQRGGYQAQPAASPNYGASNGAPAGFYNPGNSGRAQPPTPAELQRMTGGARCKSGGGKNDKECIIQ
eukprot:TRINITY_DN60179_c0_g1_i1.p1 TRINITY_DN60179_c0_g1~~TRINITY_DN60179_c0_g1_i1.p1  ORF type:complete len:420 (+),score=56.29 TRINITY_DN60179_c0_g1_i1:40-1299(+)